MRQETLSGLIQYMTIEELSPAEIALVKQAREATHNSYSPYSNFQVGCAVMTRNGYIFKGTNFENASYGMTNCAERATLAAINNEGWLQEVVALALTGRSKEATLRNEKGSALVTPCGSCRQVIKEVEDLVGQPIVILMDYFNDEEVGRVVGINTLLPLAFGPSSLAPPQDQEKNKKNETEESTTGVIKARDEKPVPRDFHREAFEKIQRGEVEVERYPGGTPSLKAIARVAAFLQAEAEAEAKIQTHASHII